MILRVLVFTALSVLGTTLPRVYAWDDTSVTPKNQKTLGLDFKLTARKHEQTFIVDFVVPPKSPLQAISRVGVFPPSSSFSAPSGLSVPFMGLTRFPRDNPTDPKQKEWVRGVRFWIGEEVLIGTQIQFDYRDQVYSIRLRDYVHP